MHNKHFNDFCILCTGRNIQEIKGCNDKNCPFYPFKYGGLEKEVESDICKKLMKETGMVT